MSEITPGHNTVISQHQSHRDDLHQQNSTSALDIRGEISLVKPFRWESTICLHPKLQELNNYPTQQHNFSTCRGFTWDTSEKVHQKKGHSLLFEISSHYRLCTKMQNCMEPTVACDLVWAVLSVEADRYSSIWGEKSHLKNHFSSFGNPTICLSLSSLWIQQKNNRLSSIPPLCHVCNQSNWLQQRDSTNLPLPVLVKAFSWYLDP